MSQANWDRVKQIFQEVLEETAPDRDRRLAVLCGEDRELRSQVETLLAAHDEAGEFLDSPTFEGASEAAAAAAGLASQDPPEGPGTRIGAYKLLQLIGEGGFGAVYMAEQEEPIRRRVALKIIKPGMDSKQVIARFEAERQALAMLDHPNIAKVFDAGATETGRPYFVMELVRGISITEFCDKNRLNTRERLALFRDTCNAVQHAHQAGIIHRDIKPSNVLVTMHDGEPMPKVIDFGVAKATHHRLTEKTLFTEYSQFIGTPAYMSPEQAELGAVEVDARTDVYSLGVLLYELLTGSTPFDTSKLRRAAYFELLRILREEEPPRPSTRLSTLGEAIDDVAKNRQSDAGALTKLLRRDLDWIALKALEKNRNRRYDSAGDLAADIDRYFESDPILARPPSPAYRLQKFVKRRRTPLAAAAVIALAFISAASFTAWQARANSSELDLDQGTRTTAEMGTVARLIWSGPEADALATPSVDGSQLYVTDWATGDLAIRDLATGKTRRLTEEQPLLTYGGMYLFPRPSPDGETVVAGFFNERYLWDLRVVDGGPPRTLYRNRNGEKSGVMPLGFTPDGARVLVHFTRADGTNQLALVSLEDGSTRTLRSLNWGELTASLSPDGRYVAYDFPPLEDSPERDVYLLATDGSSEHRLIGHPADDSQPVWAPDGSGIVFISDRAGDGDAWFLPVTDGRPDGPVELVHRNLGDVSLRGFSEDGGLVYSTRRRLSDVHVGELDTFHGTLTREPEQLASRYEGTHTSPDFSPDGSFLIHSAQRNGEPVLVIRTLATGEEREIALPGLSYGGEATRWSPEETSVLFSGRDVQGRATFMLVDPKTGGSEVLLRDTGGSAYVVWGARGRTLLYEKSDGSDLIRLVTHDLQTGEERTLLEQDSRIRDLALSPDGRSIAFRGPRGRSVLVVPVGGGAPHEVFAEPGDAFAWARDGKSMLVARSAGEEVSTRVSTLWSVPLESGEPREIGVLSTEGAVGQLVVHPDGRRFAFRLHRGYASEVWLLENFLSLR